MIKNRRYILLIRSVPWPFFRLAVEAARERFPAEPLVIIETNKDNLGRYASDLRVIHLNERRFNARTMRMHLEKRFRLALCSGVIVPVSGERLAGLEQVLAFAAGLEGVPAYVFGSDELFRRIPRTVISQLRNESRLSQGLAALSAHLGHFTSANLPGFLRRWPLHSVESKVIHWFHMANGRVCVIGTLADGGGHEDKLSVRTDDIPDTALPGRLILYAPYNATPRNHFVYFSAPIVTPPRSLRVVYSGHQEALLKLGPEPSPSIAAISVLASGYNRYLQEHPNDKPEMVADFQFAIEDLNSRVHTQLHVSSQAQYGTAPTQPEVSVVLPLYLNYDLARHQLANFRQDAYLRRQEIIYILHSTDDSSVDFEIQMQRKLHLCQELYGVPMRLVITNQSCGFAAACNIGARMATAPYLLLLNTDVFFEQPGWLERLVADLREDPSIGIAAPLLLFPDGSIQHAGLIQRRTILTGPLLANVHPFKGLDPSLLGEPCVQEVPAVTGACMLMRTAQFFEWGMMDTGYVRGDFEDSDLCRAVRAAGSRVICDQRISLRHLEGMSWPSGTRSIYFRINAQRQERKWAGAQGTNVGSRKGSKPIRRAKRKK